ncbi:MAG TPA: glycosyltransferase, partial [Ktedonobacteraceae bacterium]
KQGIAKDRLHLTGRPIRQQFLHTPANGKEETLAILGFDPAILTIFLQGGARGSVGIDQTIKTILAMNVPVQIILAAGNNEALALRNAGNENVRVLPFTETIAPYMAASDVIAGKAGASFISESFMLEKPFIATACIPAQETPSLQFIQRYNLGWVCLDTSALKRVCVDIINNPDLITEKEPSIRAYKAWNVRANQHIVPLIDQLLSS